MQIFTHKNKLALAVLLALGTAACNSDGGGQPSTQSTNTTTQTTKNSNSSLTEAQAEEAKKAEEARLAAEKAAAEEAEAKAKAEEEAKKAAEEAEAKAKAEEEAKKAAEEAEAKAKAEEEAKKAAEEAAAKAEAETKAAAQLEQEKKQNMEKSVSSIFANNSTSQSYKYAHDEAERAKLIETVKGRENTLGDGTTLCSNAKTSACSGTNAKSGDVIVSYKQSYAHYAVIRETYGLDDKPSNSFVYLVETPTTDKTQVIDATYKGKASYSSKGAPAVTSQGDFQLKVSGDTVSGVINKPASSSGNIKPVVTFNEGQIKVSGGNVVFDGTATFHDLSATGTYNGAFAGSKAEEVAGVFETDSKEKASSMQGAFAGTRQ